MKILVFGKDGQLGKALQHSIEAAVLALPVGGNQLSIQFVGRGDCDLSDGVALKALLSRCKPQLIINASAYTAVDKAEDESDLAFAVNARAPGIMAQYAAQHGATFLHYSTDYVFDGAKTGCYVEEDVRNPLGAYGKSKAAGEEAIEAAFANSKQGQYAVFRTSWVYGEGGNFIRTILRLAKDRDALNVIHDQHGVPTSASWLAQFSFDFAVDPSFSIRAFPSGIYHAVPAGETTWYGLASFAVQVALDAGTALKTVPANIKPILAVEYPLPAPRPMNSRMATGKLQNTLVSRGDMSKSQQLHQPWTEGVRAYVTQLAKDGLI